MPFKPDNAVINPNKTKRGFIPDAPIQQPQQNGIVELAKSAVKPLNDFKNMIVGAGQMAVPTVQAFASGGTPEAMKNWNEKYAKSAFNQEQKKVLEGSAEGAIGYGTKKGVGLAAYTLPAGSGLLAKSALGGLSGGASAYAEGGDIKDILTGTAIGAGTAGVLHGAGKIVNPFAKKIGKGIEQTGKDYMLKGVRPSQSSLNNFAKKTGIELQDYMAKEGLTADISHIDDAIKAIDSALEKESSSVGVIPEKTIKEAFKLARKELTGNAGFTNDENMAIAKFLKDKEVQTISKFSKGKGIEGSMIRKLKIEANAPNRAYNPEVINKQKELEDVYRSVLSKSSAGKTKDLGIKSRNLKLFRDIVNKSPKGKGNLPFNIIGSGSGATLGGIAGAEDFKKGNYIQGLGKVALGFAGGKFINNPKVITKTSQIMQGVGKNIQKPISPIIKNAVRATTISGLSNPTTFKKEKPSTYKIQKGY